MSDFVTRGQSPLPTQRTLAYATRRCKVGGKLHDHQPTDEKREKVVANEVVTERVWVCSKCGERVWWW